MNGTIKERLTKTMQTGLKWPDAFPIVLYAIRSIPNRTTANTSHHELLMGRPMSTGASPLLTSIELDRGIHD